MSIQAARIAATEAPLGRSPEPALTITRDGLVLGRTVLAKMGADARLPIDGSEERMLALLAAAYGDLPDVKILGNVRRAASAWRDGETCLALIHLAHAGLPILPDDGASERLALADRLLANGLAPRELVKICGLDPTPFDTLKAGYNLNQPRVPAGNSGGGQWTTEGGEVPLLPSIPATSGIVLANYRVVKEPPNDEKVVI
jgi:hypothetical protein